jgi:hypothetical protein
MCYELILSTTSDADLSQFNDDGLRFDNSYPDRASFAHLLYPHKWYIGSRTGCSCAFRHLYEPEHGFGAPEAWFVEGPADIEATLKFIRLVRSLIAKGERVDCVDLWAGSDVAPHPPISMNVDLSQIREEEFRFFENYHFDFVLGE